MPELDKRKSLMCELTYFSPWCRPVHVVRLIGTRRVSAQRIVRIDRSHVCCSRTPFERPPGPSVRARSVPSKRKPATKTRSPAWARATQREIARPSFEPRELGDFAKRSKSRPWSSGNTPGPSSSTTMTTLLPLVETRTMTCELACARAFSIRLANICNNRRVSPTTIAHHLRTAIRGSGATS